MSRVPFLPLVPRGECDIGGSGAKYGVWVWVWVWTTTQTRDCRRYLTPQGLTRTAERGVILPLVTKAAQRYQFVFHRLPRIVRRAEGFDGLQIPR